MEEITELKLISQDFLLMIPTSAASCKFQVPKWTNSKQFPKFKCEITSKKSLL